MDMVAKDLRYKMRVNNEYNANRLVKRMNGFKLSKEDEPWAVLLRRSYTQQKWDALIAAVGEKKLKVSIVENPTLSRAEKAAQTGDNRFARFGLSIYLYFFGIRRLARLMCVMAVLSLPVVALNFQSNLAATPGCFDGEFPLAPLACAVLVSAGNVPTFSRYDGASGEESLSHHDRHLLFAFVDILYTCVYLLGLRQLSSGARAMTSGSGDHSTASDYTIQVSGFPDDLRDPKLIREFFELRFGPVVEVNVATKVDSRLLEACAELAKRKKSLHVALARGRNRDEESKRVTKLRAVVEELKNEIAALAATVDSDSDQAIVCAFVKFDRWEDCQKALKIYDGFIQGYLTIDSSFRWTGLPEVPGSVGAAQAAAIKQRQESEAREKDDQAKGDETGEHGEADGVVEVSRAEALWKRFLDLVRTCSQGLLVDDDTGAEEDDIGQRLWVVRAPEPATIIWGSFGLTPRSLWLRRICAGFFSFALVIGTVTAFVVAHGYRGSAPIACDTAVCDERLEYPLMNQNASFPRAVLGTSAEPGVASIGLACAHPEPEEGEAAVTSKEVTKVVFRSGLTNNIGRPTCLGGYEFCQGLEDEVRRDLELSVCEQAYFKARLFSNPAFEYLPWAALVIVNVFLRWSVKLLVRRIECHTSTVARELSVAKRLFMWQFINTGLAIWLAHAIAAGSPSKVPGTAPLDATTGWGVTADSGGAQAPAPPATEPTDGLLGAQWYRETGTGLTAALLVNSLLPRTGIYLRGAWGNCARKRWCTLTCCVPTQEQLNERYAGQVLDLSERYACIWNTVFCTMFYCSGMPALLTIAAVDLCFLYKMEKKALFKYYAKRDPKDDNDDLAELSARILNYAAVLHLFGALLMYTDAGVWAKETITDSEYAKTRAPGRNTTVVIEGSSGLLDSAGDALGMRHVLLILLCVFCLAAFRIFKSSGVEVKLPPVPGSALKLCSRLRLTTICTRPCKTRITPERAYRTYTRAVEDMKLAGGLVSYDVRDSPSISAALGRS